MTKPLPDHRYWYSATLVRVVDGDTVELAIDQGLETTRRLTVRLAGVNCPERGTEAGRAATEYTKTWFYTGGFSPVLIRTVKDTREKYGRYLARIYDPKSAACLNDELIVNGHAVAYGKAADQ